MLALKTALAEADSVPVLVFDEVDANIGGETALSVGRKMREIARKRQVFCITHLAPVAASGNIHFSVEKTTQNQKTHIHVNRLNQEERLVELSRMLGGQMETARKYAQTLLQKYKTNPSKKTD
jgi:DNA repair protein RecN (Recombination protein N)